MSTRKTAQVSDESWVISAIGWSLLLGVVALFTSWKYTQYMNEKEDKLRSGKAAAAYNNYVAEEGKATPVSKTSAEPPRTAHSAPNSPPSTMTMGQRLLSSPAVTAGPGFAHEGVQETGIAILDAIERAQTHTTKVP